MERDLAILCIMGHSWVFSPRRPNVPEKKKSDREKIPRRGSTTRDCEHSKNRSYASIPYTLMVDVDCATLEGNSAQNPRRIQINSLCSRLWSELLEKVLEKP